MKIELNPFYEECHNELKRNLKEFQYGVIKIDPHTKDKYKVCFDRRLFCFGCDEGRHGKTINIEEILKIREKTYKYNSQICEGCSNVYKKIKPLLPPIVYNLSHEGIIEFKIPKTIFSRYFSYLKEFYDSIDKNDETVILSCTDGGEISSDILIFKLMIIKKTEEIKNLFWIDVNGKKVNKTKVPWGKLSSEEFEEFCNYLLDKDGFIEIKWHGKGGGDGGRDYTAKKVFYHKKKKIISNWIVTCKRYISKPPSKTLLYEEIVKAEGYSIDDLLFVISNTLSSKTKDWLEAQKNKHSFSIHTWEELDLKRMLFSDKELLLRYFPELYCSPISKQHYAIFIDHFFKKLIELKKIIKENLINDVIVFKQKKDKNFSKKDILEEILPLLDYKISSSWFAYQDHLRISDLLEFKEKIAFILELFYEKS